MTKYNAELTGIILSEVDDGAFDLMLINNHRAIFECILMATAKNKHFKIGSMIKVIGNIVEDNKIAVHYMKNAETKDMPCRRWFNVLDDKHNIIQFSNKCVYRLITPERLEKGQQYVRHLKPVHNSKYWRVIL